MTKRNSATEIDHENYTDDDDDDDDIEEESEEAGTFPIASEEELENRVILKGRRHPQHMETDDQQNVFSQFNGFNGAGLFSPRDTVTFSISSSGCETSVTRTILSTISSAIPSIPFFSDSRDKAISASPTTTTTTTITTTAANSTSSYNCVTTSTMTDSPPRLFASVGTFPAASEEKLENGITLNRKSHSEHMETNDRQGIISKFHGFDVPGPTGDNDVILNRFTNCSSNGMLSKGFSFSPGNVFTSFNTTSSTQPAKIVTTNSSAGYVISTTGSVFSTFASAMPSMPFFSASPTTTTITTTTTAANSATSICEESPTQKISSVIDSPKCTVASVISTVKSVFPYVNNNSTTAPTTTTTDPMTSESSIASSHPSPLPRDEEFFTKLKTLNESVTSWITKHINENPYCMLTPVFEDYVKYYKELDRSYPLYKPDSTLKCLLKPVNNVVSNIASHFVPSDRGANSPVITQSVLDQPITFGGLAPSFSLNNFSEIANQSADKNLSCADHKNTLKPDFISLLNPVSLSSDNEEIQDDDDTPFELVEEGAFYSQRRYLV